MQYEETGTIIRGLGGLYEIELHAGSTPMSGRRVPARAKGHFRREGLSPLVGDGVRVIFDEHSFVISDGGEPCVTADGGGFTVEEILPRKNALIRPPMANLDLLFITFAAAEPTPVLDTVDKLIAIAEHNGIEPAVVIGKCDLDPDGAAELARTYERAGFHTFCLSASKGDGVAALRRFLCEQSEHRIAAFAGASGVGKSTLLNALFPVLALETGEISRKIARGRHTTRRVELYEIPERKGFYIADTPGFSMLDFVRFDFFGREDLPLAMREFAPYLGQCRFTKCSHTKEQGCAVLEAVREGDIAPSRHKSFLLMYEALKDKNEWSKK